MMYRFKIWCFIGFINLFLTGGLGAQPWTMVKEKDGIKVYTRTESNSSWKSFKGEVTFKASIDKVNALLGTQHIYDWWPKEITDVKVLGYETDQSIQYYMVFNLPWPFKNRDIVSDTRITTDRVTGVSTYAAVPLPRKVPEKPDFIRIKDYRQIWTVRPEGKESVHVTLEGSINPGGDVPAWLFNMVISETPLKTIEALRQRSVADARSGQ